MDVRPRNTHQLMETTAPFDLNHALHSWLDCLSQSPQVKADDLKELESHVRDSVGQLQMKGLSSEESFLVATHRVGNPVRLEPEFAKVNRSPLNAIIHGLILTFFSVSCWFLWGVLHLPQMTQGMLARAGAIDAATGNGQLPGFTMLMVTLRDFIFIPPLLALGYCLYLWFRKSGTKGSWTGFFATTTATLIFIMLPTLIAVVLPVIALLNRLGTR